MELLSHLKYNSNLRSLLMFPFDFEFDENIGEQSVCTRMYVISGPITTAQGLYFEQFDMDSYLNYHRIHQFRKIHRLHPLTLHLNASQKFKINAVTTNLNGC